MKDYKSMDKRKNVLGMVWVNLIRKFGEKINTDSHRTSYTSINLMCVKELYVKTVKPKILEDNMEVPLIKCLRGVMREGQTDNEK